MMMGAPSNERVNEGTTHLEALQQTSTSNRIAVDFLYDQVVQC